MGRPGGNLSALRVHQRLLQRHLLLAVRHLDAWYQAFNIQPGDKRYLPPEKRARIW